MSLVQALIAELDQESRATHALLARVPGANPGWRPHPKSMPLGTLAMHIAEMPHWSPNIVTESGYDVAPVDGPPHVVPAFTGAADATAMFDAGVASCRAALSQTTDGSLAEPWNFIMGGQVLFTMPRSAALRNWVFNHMVHHRAQLGVYLRLLDVPLPGTYGPSADESM